MLTEEAFLKGTALLRVAGFPNSPNFKLEEIKSLWYDSLSDLTDEQFAKAVQQAIKESRFFPMIADLREMAGMGKSNEVAFLAWISVIKAIEKMGYYQSPKFKDPVISHVIDAMGGWMTLSTALTDDNLRFIEREFREKYEVLKNHVTEAVPVVGFLEYENRKKSHLSDKRQDLIEKAGVVDKTVDNVIRITGKIAKAKNR